MTALDLPAIRALLAGATPGPWEAGTLGGHAADVFTVESDEDLGRIVICEHAGSDAAFIAAAPSIVTQLLAAVTVLEEHAALAEALCEMNGTDKRLASVPVAQIRAALTGEGQ